MAAPPKLYSLARMTTATTGTGTITLGSAVSGFLTFAGAGVADAEVVTYAIKDGVNSEIGTGTYTSSGTTLTRTVVKSTNSDTAINLSGSAEVFITPSHKDFVPSHRGLLLARVHLATAVSINTATWTSIIWDTNDFDDHGSIINLSANGRRLNVPSGYTRARVTGYCAWEANSSGDRLAAIQKNQNATLGSVSYGVHMQAAKNESGMYVDSGWLASLTGGTDYFELFIFQDSGASRNTSADSHFAGVPWFQMEILP